ncbi:MAG TPA: hypothetical protein VFG10_17430 [Saprospiraceae bacterium]|nr:hypothetical protein [Saprospiraceae bacterium]
MDAVDEYLDLVQINREAHESDDDSDQLLSDVDPGVNEFEDQLEFLCISSLYDSLEYLDDEFRSSPRSTVDIYIGDPELQLLLNREHEVWIEDTIYKVVADFKYYKIADADLDVLNSLRSDPEEPTVNENTTLVYFSGNVPPVAFLPECHAFLQFLVPPLTSGLEIPVTVQLFIVNSVGVVSLCIGGGTVTIDWGDGSTPDEVPNNFSGTHTYLNLEPDEKYTFIIEASLDVENSQACGGCDQGIYTASTSITITNTFCRNSGINHEILHDQFFSAGGHDWKVSGTAGYQSIGHFLDRAKVFGELFLYRKNGNGNYVRKKPTLRASTRTYGSVFNYTNCTENEDDFDETKSKQDNRVYVHYSKNGNLSVQDELTDEPRFDYKVYITSWSIPNQSNTGLELFP